MRLYIDIDGTLTERQRKWANPIQSRIDKVKALIEAGHEVIIWSGSTRYARLWCRKYGIKPKAALGKPQHIVDNKQNVRPSRLMADREPDWLDTLDPNVETKADDF